MSQRVASKVAIGLALSFLIACGGPTEQAGSPETEPSAAEGEAAPTTAAPAATSAADSPGDDQAARVEDLYEAAKAEGEVSAWVQMDEDEFSILADAFQQRFPEITATRFDIRPEEALTRLSAEAAAGGDISADALQTNLPTAEALLDRDLIETYDWSSLAIPEEGILGDDWGVGFFHAAYVMAYNTDRLDPSEVPQSWEALLEDRWQGDILFEQRGIAVSGLHPVWGEDKVLEYTQGIMDQSPILTSGATTTIQSLAAGQASIAVGPLHYRVSEAKADGAPVELVPNVPASTRVIGTVALRGPHPNAGKLWTYWLGTTDGQEAVVESQGAGLITEDSDTQAVRDLQGAGVELLSLDSDQVTIQGELEEQMQGIIAR